MNGLDDNHIVGGCTWRKSSAVPMTGASNLAALQGTTFPDSSTILASIVNMNLETYSQEVTSTANGLRASIGNTITTSADDALRGISDQLAIINDIVSSSTLEHVDLVNSKADSFIPVINNSFDQVMVYDNYR